MKNSYLAVIMVLIASAGHNCWADSLPLKASDGTQIDLSYEKKDFENEGDSSGSRIDGLAISLSNYGYDSIAVVTVSCQDTGFRYIYSISCQRDSSGLIQVDRNCRLDSSDPYTKTYFRDSFWELTTSVNRRDGSFRRCGFELSIFRDNGWLTDSVNGTHNFVLNF